MNSTLHRPWPSLRRKPKGGDSEDDEEEELAPLRRAQALVARLRRRDLYKFCHEVTIPPQHAENFTMPTAGGELAQAELCVNSGCSYIDNGKQRSAVQTSSCC